MPRQNTSPADYPPVVLQQIEKLAQNIAVARKRRGETQAQWAKKLGVSQPTFARIERGDPGVAMASYVMCMWLIDPAVGLADLVSPQSDQSALEREVRKITKKRKAAVPADPAKLAGINLPAAQKHAYFAVGVKCGRKRCSTVCARTESGHSARCSSQRMSTTCGVPST